MIRAAFVSLALVFVSTSTAEAALTTEKLRSFVSGTVRVNSMECKGEKTGVTKKGSGFAINTGDGVAIITSLHVVSACKRYLVTDHRGGSAALTVSRILPSADLAMLKVAPGLDVKPLVFSSTDPAGGTPVTVLGFGRSREILSRDIKVRALGPSTLDGVLDDQSTKRDLARLGIDIRGKIINLEGVIMPGDSGAPVFNDQGEVVGIAAGGLQAGTLPVTWAVPADNLTALARSTEVFDPEKTTINSDVLSAEVERVSGTSEQPVFESLSRPAIRCGARTFELFGSRSFNQIRDSADTLSAQQINYILGFAATFGVSLNGSEMFNIFADVVSGAVFVLPANFKVKHDPSSGDCLAFDSGQRFSIRIAGQSTDPLQRDMQSDAFARRALGPYEFLSGSNPSFSMFQPMSRAHDGMIVKRAAFFINNSATPYNPYEDLNVSHAMRNNTYLGVSLRSYTTTAGRDPKTWLLALLAVHVSGFAL